MAYYAPLDHCCLCGRSRGAGHRPDCPANEEPLALRLWPRLLFPAAALLILLGILFLAARGGPAPAPAADCPCYVGAGAGPDCGCRSEGQCACVAYCSCRDCPGKN